MAGENSLPVQHFPDDFSIETISLPLVVPTTGWPVLYADRDLVIDSITVGICVASTTSSQTAIFSKTTSGIRNASDNSKITPAQVFTSPTSIMAAGSVAISTIGTYVLTTDSATNNLSASLNRLDAGNWLIFVPSGATVGMTCTIQVRVRSRQK